MEFLSKILTFLKGFITPDEAVVDSWILKHKRSLILFVVALLFVALGYFGIFGFILSLLGFGVFGVLGYFQFKRE